MATKRDNRSSKKSAPGDKPLAETDAHKGGYRDLAESLIVALILAFLFKTFIAEAFVIPTGSMAPTLRGIHVEARNPQGLITPVGAKTDGDRLVPTLEVTLPLYSETLSLKDGKDGRPGAAVMPYLYDGDRILVSKNAYLFRDPQRWDIVVFKCPDEAERNFIKRMVGGPNETVRIFRGDIYSRPKGERQFQIARKQARHVLACMQLVYDSRYVSPELREMGYVRLAPDDAHRELWTTSDGGQSFRMNADADDVRWLSYHHMQPTWDDWQAIRSGGQPAPPKRRLITDFCAYNTAQVKHVKLPPSVNEVGAHWVGDLVGEATVAIEELTDPAAELGVRLVKGGRIFELRLPVGRGEATLDLADGSPLRKAPSPITRPGTWKLRVSNVDSQVFVWVNGRLIHFDKSTDYQPWPDTVPDEQDLRPVRFGGKGLRATWSNLAVHRDIHYIDTRSTKNRGDTGPVTSDDRYRNEASAPLRDTDFLHYPFAVRDSGSAQAGWNYTPAFTRSREQALRAWAEFYASPELWSEFRDDRLSYRDFPLGEGEFFMLGDNSANSADSRYWRRYAVERRLLIGKALYIYWPHGWETPWHLSLPNFRNLRFPFYPDFTRMGRIE